MAYTERYVSVAGAGAHDGTSEANAWTFDEMIAAAPSGVTRVNIKSGSYSVGAYNVGSGAANGSFVIRGYSSTIGDLDNPAYNSDGTLNTTGFPLITITSTWTPGSYSVLQNLNITAAISNAVYASTTVDNFAVHNCKIQNTQNNASARCIQGDNTVILTNCDFECTGAAHASLVDIDFFPIVLFCRFKTTSSSSCLTTEYGSFVNNLFYGGSSSVGIQLLSTASPSTIISNTFVSIGTAIQFPNAVNTGLNVIYNNHATGCSKFIDSLYSSTANYSVIVGTNRTRNITTLYTGLEEIEFGAITTAGTDSDDFVDAGAGNFYLKATAAGTSAGMRLDQSVGAYQRDQTGSGGGGVVGRLVNSNNLVG